MGGASKDQKYVDELCNILRKGCSLLEFKNACIEFHSKDQEEEVKAGDTVQQPEIDNEFFSVIGTLGWSVIHAACSSNNAEVVEYLINKRRVNPNLKGKDDWSPLEISI